MANAYVYIVSEHFGPAEDSEKVNTHNIILYSDTRIIKNNPQNQSPKTDTKTC